LEDLGKAIRSGVVEDKLVELVYLVSTIKGLAGTLIGTSIVGESRAIQYRLEVFNLSDHPNFNLPENNVAIPTAGTIWRAKSSRNLQMSLRLES
jgi:hypothetical protein